MSQSLREPKARPPDDAALLDGVARADRAAFRALFDRYHAPVHRFAYRLTGGADRADEVANDTLMAVWNGAAGFEGRAKPSTWIFGIAYRLAHKSLRRKGVERGSVDIEAAAEIVDESVTAPDEAAYHKEVGAAIGTLPTDLKAVLELTYFNGHSLNEVAEIVGCPLGTVKSRMHEARKRLKEKLA